MLAGGPCRDDAGRRGLRDDAGRIVRAFWGHAPGIRARPHGGRSALTGFKIRSASKMGPPKIETEGNGTEGRGGSATDTPAHAPTTPRPPAPTHPHPRQPRRGPPIL